MTVPDTAKATNASRSTGPMADRKVGHRGGTRSQRGERSGN